MADVTVLLDSGAFSVWKRGAQIDLKEYMRFLHDAEQYLDGIVALDVLPGTSKRIPTSVEVEESAAASFKQYRTMRAAALQPMPVYHQGESFDWVKRYRDEGVKSIGISPRPNQPRKAISRWLDEVWADVGALYGKKLPWAHGFGLASAEELHAHPWRSADASTWAYMASIGAIIIAPVIGGKHDYSRAPIYVGVSDYDTKPNLIRKSTPRNSPFASPERVARLRHYAESFGVDLEDARRDCHARRRINLGYFANLEQNLDGKRVVIAHPPSMVVSGYLRQGNKALRHRLISYADLMTYRNPLDKLKAFIERESEGKPFAGTKRKRPQEHAAGHYTGNTYVANLIEDE